MNLKQDIIQSKWRVTPKQSEILQKFAFENGYSGFNHIGESYLLFYKSSFYFEIAEIYEVHPNTERKFSDYFTEEGVLKEESLKTMDSAKEKAEELVDRYFKAFGGYNKVQDDFEWNRAKQCATICVDEILDIRNNLYFNEGSLFHQYFLDVKTEIEKL